PRQRADRPFPAVGGADAHPARKLEDDRAGDEAGEGKREHRPGRPHPRGQQPERQDDPHRPRRKEVVAERSGGRAAPGEQRRHATSPKAATMLSARNPRKYPPNGDCVKEWTLLSTPLRVRKVPKIDSPNASTTSDTVHC